MAAFKNVGLDGYIKRYGVKYGIRRGIFVGEPPGHYNQVYSPLIRYKLPNTNLPFICAKSAHIYFEDVTPDIPWSIDCFHETFTLDDLKKMIELYNQKY